MTDFAQRYRSMSDYRLAQLAADPNALVPDAREALRAEIARRPPPMSHSSGEVENLVSAKDSLDGVGGRLAGLVLSRVIWRGLQRDTFRCFTPSGGQQRSVGLLNVQLGNRGVEPGDRYRHHSTRTLRPTDGRNSTVSRRPPGIHHPPRWDSASGFLSSLGWIGFGVDRRRRGYLRRLRYLAPVLPGIEASEDNVWSEFVNFATLRRALKTGHAPSDRFFLPRTLGP